MSYPGHLFVGGGVSYPSAEVQSVYFTALANWTNSSTDYGEATVLEIAEYLFIDYCCLEYFNFFLVKKFYKKLNFVL